jgi:hypothetical protein
MALYYRVLIHDELHGTLVVPLVYFYRECLAALFDGRHFAGNGFGLLGLLSWL